MGKDSQQAADEKDAVIKELEETYRKFLRLYERFTTDRLTVSKQGETLGKIIDELKAESALATEFKVHVRQGIVATMKKAMEEVDGQVKKAVQESVTEEVKGAIKEFKAAIDSSTEILRVYTEENKSRAFWVCFEVLFCGLIFFLTTYTAVVVKKYVPNSYLTSEQISVYRSGLICENMWNRLSKKEQDRLLSIENGKLPPEEDSYEWIKKNNPNMKVKDIQKKFKELSNS